MTCSAFLFPFLMESFLAETEEIETKLKPNHDFFFKEFLSSQPQFVEAVHFRA